MEHYFKLNQKLEANELVGKITTTASEQDGLTDQLHQPCCSIPEA